MTDTTSSSGTDAQPNEPPLVGQRSRWLVLTLMCSGLLLVAMDNTILNVALPAIADALRPSNTGLLWIIDLYSLVVAGLLVAAGTASDRLAGGDSS